MELSAESQRLADRLRSLSDVRLARELEPGRTSASAALAAAQRLADLAAGVEHREAPDPPAPRLVPTVADFAVGDVIAVTGHDLAAAARALPADMPVWLDGARSPLAAAVAEGAALCRSLRLTL